MRGTSLRPFAALAAAGFAVGASRGDVIVSEIMYHPASENSREEFVELHNTASTNVSLAGWRLAEGVQFTFPALAIGPTGYVVVAADTNVFKVVHPGVAKVVGNWTGTLANDGEDIELLDRNGLLADRVDFADEGDWGRRARGRLDHGHRGWSWQADHDGSGRSLELVNPALPNDYGQNWASSPVYDGSPGAANGARSTNIAPMVLDVRHVPPIPGPDDPVTVLARLVDERTNGLQATLRYRPDGAPAFTAVAMADDGMRSDGLRNDGVYGAAIPAMAAGTVVEFYLEAADSSGRTRTWPAPVDMGPKVLGRWLFDEAGGTTAADSSGRRIDGLLTNGAAFVPGGVRGRAVQFDGTNDFVLLESRVSPEPPLGAETFTLAAWFKRAGAGSLASTGGDGVSAEPLLTKGRTESNYDLKDANWFLGLVPAGTGVVLAADFEEHVTSFLPAQNHPLTGVTAVADGVWHHAAATYDGTLLTLYIDGLADVSLAVTSTPNHASIQPAAVGAALGSTGSRQGAFRGLVDEAVVLRDALDADGIRFLMTNGAPPAVAPEQSCNLLLQVDAAADPEGAAVHRLIMKEAERAELDALGGSDYESFSDARMNGTFISRDGAGTKVRYVVGIRNRGNGTRTADPNNHRVEFASDAKWNGLGSVNLNSRFTPAQVAGSLLVRRAGVPAAAALPVGVRVDGQDLADPGAHMYGAYAQLEALDGDFAQARFGDDGGGNLYQAMRVAGGGADLDYEGPDAAAYKLNYAKRTNRSEDDWSDLVALTWALSTNTPDGTYTQAVEHVVNVGQWLRYLAVMTVLANNETSLDNGAGDDYYLYRGTNDPRFVLVPHDLDTILGSGYEPGSVTGGLFRFSPLEAVDRFVKRPEYAPRYYGCLRELAQTVFTRRELDRLLDPLLAARVPAAPLESLKAFATNRCAWILAQIPADLSVACDLVPSSGVYRTAAPSVDLYGAADPVRTRRVEAAGIEAAWSAWECAWSAAAVPLRPGLNRIGVRAFDGEGSTVGAAAIDVWRDGAAWTAAPDMVTGSSVWSAASGPWLATGEVYVTSSSTLTIEPGATVLFEPGANLSVGGVLIAEGRPDARIRFGCAPGATNAWLGLRFYHESRTSVLAHVDIDCQAGGHEAVKVWKSSLRLDDVTWTSPSGTVMSVFSSAVHVARCTFPEVNGFDAIYGEGMPSNGTVVVESNVFGHVHGYADAIDFTGGNRPGPILQVLGNIFLGGDDDALDLDGTDAHVEGNLFMGFHKGEGNDSSSSAIATGTHDGRSADIVAVRNIFAGNDHAALVKEGSILHFAHNTVVDCAIAALNFDEPDEAASPGLGASVAGCIFEDCALVFENAYDHDPVKGTVALTVDRSLLPSNLWHYGAGNVAGDPRFVDPAGDFHLRPGSPAAAAGPLGLDMGAMVPAGAALAGEPETPTRLTSARLDVGGPGIAEYRHRVNGGSFGSAQSVTNPVVLSGLTAGVYRVEAIGMNSAGVWQDAAAAATSLAWTVAPTLSRLVINEVLAANATVSNLAGTYPDLIELRNAGAVSVSLAGMRMTDDPAVSNKYVFPSGTALGAGQFMILYADTNAGLPGIHVGFALKQGGEGVYLYNSPGAGGGLVDSVAFGVQAPDLSIGRGRDGGWCLCRPTFGRTNEPAALGDPSLLLINEWLTDGSGFFMDDYIELLNTDPLPVALGGLYLTDDPAGFPARHALAPLSFVAGRGHVVLTADGHPELGPDHLSFALASEQGSIGLFDQSLVPIDVVFYGPQQSDASQGRTPDGSDRYTTFVQPNPGAGNPPGTNGVIEMATMADLTSVWRFNEACALPATNWMAVDYDDSGWPTGVAVFAHDPDPLDLPTNTHLTLGCHAYYFRREFVLDGQPGGEGASMLLAVDDGVVVYLNGREAFRLGMPAGPITYTNHATRSVGNARLEGPFTVSSEHLKAGTNLLAAEVHQQFDGSSDVVFGLSLAGPVSKPRAALLNEVLAFNTALPGPGGTWPDWVELHNPMPFGVGMAGLGLTDDLALPYKWAFPDGAVVPPGGFLVVWCDSAQPASASNTGFGLDWEGDGVYLFDDAAHGGGLLDGVSFGMQAADRSVARHPDGTGEWGFAAPTPGGANAAAALGDPAWLRINEWMASPASGEDWFELFNPGPLPVEVSGMYLTDDLLDWNKNRLPPRSYMGCLGGGYKKFMADENLELGAHHVVFKLSGKGESLGVFTRELIPVDAVTFGAQATGVSEGRLPDGTGPVVSFPGTASPEAANHAPDSDGDGMPDPWEQVYGFDPGAWADGGGDADSDGVSNAAEYVSGTDPRLASSLLELVGLTPTGGHPRVAFEAVAGKTYALWKREHAGSGWVSVGPVGPIPVSGPVECDDPSMAGPSQRWYRVSTSP